MNDDNNLDKKIFDYIALLEKTNDELVNTLKHCVRLLVQFNGMVSEPEEWEKMTDSFQELIKIAERVTEKKTFH